MGILSFQMVLEGSRVLCVCTDTSPELLECSAVGVGTGASPCVCTVLRCYSQPLVGVLMVLKECRLLSACTGISTVPLLSMVLEEYRVLCGCVSLV